MFIIIIGDAVDRTSPIIYNIDGVILTSIQPQIYCILKEIDHYGKNL